VYIKLILVDIFDDGAGDIVNDERCSLDPVLSTQAQLIIHENLDLFPMNYSSGAAKKTR
jgi:hypothetical protein